MWNDSDKGLCLFVNTPSGSVISLRNLRSSSVVKNLKERLELETGIPGELINVSYSLRPMKNEDALSALSIKNGSVLRLCFPSTAYEQLYKAMTENNVEALFSPSVLCLKDSLPETNNETGVEVWNTGIKYKVSVALFMASAFGNIDVLGTLLQKSALDRNFQTTYGRTAMHVAAFHNSAATINLLLGYGFDPNFHDNDGMIPLQIAKLYKCPHSERRLWVAKVSSIYQSSERPRLASASTEIRASFCDPDECLQVKESYTASPAHSDKQCPLPYLCKERRLTKTRSKDSDAKSKEISLPQLKDTSEFLADGKENQLFKDNFRSPILTAKGKELSQNTYKVIKDLMTKEESFSDTVLVKENPAETLNDSSRVLLKYAGDDSDKTELENFLKLYGGRKLIKSVTTNTLKSLLVDLKQEAFENTKGRRRGEEPLLGLDKSKLTLSLNTEHYRDLIASKDEKERVTEVEQGQENLPGVTCPKEKLSPERLAPASMVLQDVNSSTFEKKPDTEQGTASTSLDTKTESENSEIHVTSMTLSHSNKLISHTLNENRRRLSFDAWLSRKRLDKVIILKRSNSTIQGEESQKGGTVQKNRGSEAFKEWLARKKELEKRNSTVEYDVIRTDSKSHNGLTFEQWLEDKKNETLKIKDHTEPTAKQVIGNKTNYGLTHEEWLEKKKNGCKKLETSEDHLLGTDKGKTTGLSFEKWLEEKENSSKIEMISRATKLEAEEIKRNIEQYNRLSSGRVITFSEWLLMKKYSRNHHNIEPRENNGCLKNPAGDSKLVYNMWMLNKHIKEMAEEEKKTMEMRELWEQKRRKRKARESKVR